MVGRMIQRARNEKLIEVKSNLTSPIDSELSRELSTRFSLTSTYVVSTPPDNEAQARSIVADVSAKIFMELVEEDDAIGLTPGRTIIEMCSHLHQLPVCDVVQLTGVATTDAGESLRAVMSISGAANGRAFPLHAPLLTTDSEAWQVISTQPAVQQALQRMNWLDKAVLTIGGWPDSSLLASQAELMGDSSTLKDAGVVAEIGTTLLNVLGEEVVELRDRTIGISHEQLRNIPFKIGIGGGPGKEQAVLAVLRSGLVDAVVTDTHSAQFALSTS